MQPHSTLLAAQRQPCVLRRCQWAPGEDPTNPLVPYHDEEWGRPSRDDRHLFEMLCLEGAQVLPSAACSAAGPPESIGQLATGNSHSVSTCATVARTTHIAGFLVSKRVQGYSRSANESAVLRTHMTGHSAGSHAAGGSQLADHPQAEGRLPEGVRRLGRRRRRSFQRRGGAVIYQSPTHRLLLTSQGRKPAFARCSATGQQCLSYALLGRVIDYVKRIMTEHVERLALSLTTAHWHPQVEALLQPEAGLIRHRGKVHSVVANAKCATRATT